jgi:hypothetical protein
MLVLVFSHRGRWSLAIENTFHIQIVDVPARRIALRSRELCPPKTGVLVEWVVLFAVFGAPPVSRNSHKETDNGERRERDGYKVQ